MELKSYLLHMPEDLHIEAKVQAAREQTTLKEIILKALTEYLERVGR
jgi:hypothetical protein